MSQTFNTDTYDGSHVGSTDLQNIETNFNTLKSNFSGTSQPSNVVAGQSWFDTSNKILKIRNQANSAWLGVMYGNSSNKIWIYSNSATDGWTVDSSIADKVIAIKSLTPGDTYYVSGGNTAGTWAGQYHRHTDAHTHGYSHNHQWFDDPGLSSTSKSYNSSGSSVVISYGSSNGGTHINTTTSIGTPVVKNDYYTADYSGSTTSQSTSYTAYTGSDATRPYAAVGTLQYPSV